MSEMQYMELTQKELTDLLAKYARAYYVEDAPLVEDAVYDKMYDTLVEMEKQTGIVYGNSPTARVQGECVPYLKKVKHSKPMLSCAKTKDLDEVGKFFDAGDFYHCFTSLKLDGLTVCVNYDNGVLTQAVTRGSGVEGEDITHNAKFIQNLPKRISTLEHIEIRGECVIANKDFEKICKVQDFANPRNAAAGILRRLEPVKGLTDLLSFYAFDLTFPESRFATKVSMMRWLETIGFETVIGKFCKTKEEVFDFIADIGNNKPDTPIDGCVIEYNGLDFAKSLGATAHHENRHLAFKYTDEVVETIFRGVELNTGRNGIVSITGIFDPVEIDGTVVSRASLHNVDIFRALELGIGDTITVYKANQIIPQIQDNLTRSGMYTLPNCCPCCGERLEIIKNVNTHVLNCPNPACSSKLLQRLVLFVSKDGMDIDGLGESQLAEFIDKGWLKDPYDIYWELPNHREEIRNMEGWGYTSMDNLMNAIYNSRTTDLAHFITALGIPSVGKSTAKLIAEDCEWNFETWCSKMGKGIFFDHIDSIGPATAGEIMNWFQMPTNKAILMEFTRDIAMHDFTFIVPEKKEIKASIFSGKSFCITGTFDMGSRPGIIAQVEALGGKSVGSVSKKTDFLLAGRDCGSKLQKAKDCGVRIIEEAELKEMLNGI